MKKRLVLVPLLGGILAIGLPVWAHHGNAAYDMKSVEMKGVTVTKFFWANPHCILQFDAKDENGKVTHWAAELGSPSAIGLVGFTKSTFQPGDVITIQITLSKTGNPVGRIRRVTLADGTVLPHGGGEAPDDAGGGRGGRSGSAY
jgi:hypothetical protein